MRIAAWWIIITVIIFDSYFNRILNLNRIHTFHEWHRNWANEQVHMRTRTRTSRWTLYTFAQSVTQFRQSLFISSLIHSIILRFFPFAFFQLRFSEKCAPSSKEHNWAKDKLRRCSIGKNWLSFHLFYNSMYASSEWFSNGNYAPNIHVVEILKMSTSEFNIANALNGTRVK